MNVGVIGAGRVATAVATLLRRAGHTISGASGGDRSRERVTRFLPGVPIASPVEAARGSDVVVLGVPDDAIAPTCAELAAEGAFTAEQTVLHLSGSAPLLALGPARAAGAVVLSLHPLQTAPTVEDALKRLPGSTMAVSAWVEEGYEIGERLAREAGGRPFRLPDDRRSLYHAAAVFASNYVVAVTAVAERLFESAGLDDALPMFAPLVEATVSNVLRLGPAEALTGPAARADAGTVRRNLEALTPFGPVVVESYVALARVVLDLAEGSGRLAPADRARVEEVLASWR